MDDKNIEILAVVVLYRCNLLDSLTIKSLLVDYISNPEPYKKFRLIIYDNSEIKQSIKVQLPFRFNIIQDESNAGLAKAYNFALDSARANSINWLLLLDQDSTLPNRFLSIVQREIEITNSAKNIKAIVPRVEYDGRPISPARDLIGGMLRPIKAIQPGECHIKIHAIGSGLILKTEIFKTIGEFSVDFPVDGLDRWLYHQISAMGWSSLISEIKIEHSLSVFNFEKFVSYERYINILTYEYKYLKLYRSNADITIYNLRLILRAIKYFKCIKNKKFSIITIRHLINKYNDKANNNYWNNNIQ